MPTTARDQLARLLAGAEEQHPDSAMTFLPDDALRVQVAGVGDITLPIRAPQAKKLIAVARPASFGRGEETLHDDSVRDTWELTPDQVSLGGDWQRHLDLALADLRDDLGLPYGARLRAELHSMLVYGKGQFFLPHQDSEKHDDMVATLVVSLPSVHTGGELVVDDGGRERIYRASRADLVLVAFYASRRHEVRPVRSGYRVTLTFNLLLDASPSAADSGPVSALAELLTEHFTTPAHSPYGGRDRGAPTRLAFLLDHEYSQRGLAASRFKGADADRVAMLRAAAAEAGCELVLALAEIRETRDALPAWRGRRHRYHGEEFEDDWDHQEEDLEVGDLIDDEITLGWWIGPGTSPGERIKLRLNDSEVCAATPSSALTPYDSEYEGFMGNYGNTLDRWYRRAAVVLWPKDKAFAARAEADPARALGVLLDRIDAGDLAGARADAASLKPFWSNLDPATLRLSLRVALGLRDAATASLVLAPYRLEMLTAEEAAPLAAVITAYGDPWGRALLDSWDSVQHYRTDRVDWVTGSLAPVCRALADDGATSVADQLTDRAWRWLRSQVQMWVGQQHPGRRATALTELGMPLARILECASDDLGAAVVGALPAADDRAIALLVAALRAHQPPTPPAISALAGACRGGLEALLARPVRAAGDWSIDWTGCGCADCERLATFLGSATDLTEAWPLAKPRRQHLHAQIDGAALPVSHITRRQGRPYSLVLTKTDDLFARETADRQRAEADLRWLMSAFGPSLS